ncbi:hypothetical protein ACHHYP_10033 [Achlya hypogyna]|uniref:Uncharacterized protein n=1 Tax=Achlya hypogyna TaxID=1202772 RepID=A0A1V9ZIH8_ACHHY|nr:hypothetical protein ACHHYP_10033 [Achlya hypogyna]
MVGERPQSELAKVRAEGDWVLIKIEMEKKAMAKTEAALERTQKEIDRLRAAKGRATSRAYSRPLRRVRRPTRRDHPRPLKRLEEHEERAKQALHAKLQEIAKLRQAIDDARRARLEATAVEAKEAAAVRTLESKIAATHSILHSLQARDRAAGDDIKALQASMVAAQSQFLAEEKVLLDQMKKPAHEAPVARSADGRRKVSQSTPPSLPSLAVVARAKEEHALVCARRGPGPMHRRWLRTRRKFDLAKRTESLEHKKELVDLALARTQAPSIPALLQVYALQEAHKAALCAKLDQRATHHSSLLAAVADVERDLLQLRGHDVRATPPSDDLRRALEATAERTRLRAADVALLEDTLSALVLPVQQLFTATHAAPAPPTVPPLPACSHPPCAPHQLVALLARVDGRASEQVLSRLAQLCQATAGDWATLPAMARFLQLRQGGPAPAVVAHGPSTRAPDDDVYRVPVHSKALRATNSRDI